MKRVNFRLFALAIALVATSCVKDVVVDSNFHGTPSEKICFGAELKDTGEDTRGGVVSNRVGKHDLKSADGEFVLPMGVYVEDGIGCADAAETRGALFTEAGKIDDFTVWAKHKVGDNVSAYFNGVVYEKNTADNVFYSNDEYMWPGDGELTFVAVTNAPDSGFVPNCTADSEDILESFTYTVPTDATKQNDIVLAKATYDGGYEASAPLKFEHIMTAVNFKVGSIVEGEIRSIKVKNVYNEASYLVDQGVWALNSTGDFSVTMNGDPYVVPNESDDKTINPKGAVLMMIPQVLPEDAVIEVEFYDSESKNTTKYTASIKDDVWDMGKTTNYVISIGETFNIEIEPIGKLLDAHYIIKEIKVTVNDTQATQNGEEWILSASIVDAAANDEKVTLMPETLDNITTSLPKHATELNMIQNGFWCDKYVTIGDDGKYTPNNTSARGFDQIEGTGNVSEKIFYVMIPENNSTSDRNIKITLHKKQNANVSRTLYMTQRAPRWTGDTPGSYGWETVDDNEDGRYGFIFTRKIAWAYVYSHAVGGISSLAPYDFQALEMSKQEVFDYINDDFIKAYGAEKFAKFDDSTRYVYETGLFNVVRNYRYYIHIDYTLLNTLEDIESSTDGHQNTKKLNTLGGSASTLAFETILSNAKKTKEGNPNDATFRPHGWNWQTMEVDNNLREKTKDGSIADIPMPEGSIDDLSGILSYVLKKNRYYLYDPGDDGVSSTVLAPIILESDIKWYIPAYEQFSTFVPDPNITDKNGDTDSKDDYWSSTAGENNENAANALSYNGNGDLISRSTELGVIAVRVFDDDTKTATATIDEINTEEMKGGENGEAQWVE